MGRKFSVVPPKFYKLKKLIALYTSHLFQGFNGFFDNGKRFPIRLTLGSALLLRDDFQLIRDHRLSANVDSLWGIKLTYSFSSTNLISCCDYLNTP